MSYFLLKFFRSNYACAAWTIFLAKERKHISDFTLPLIYQCPYGWDACQFEIFVVPHEQWSQL